MSSSPSPNLPSGIICSSADYALSSSEDPRNISLYCLTRDESIALSFAIETSFLSLLAVLLVFALIIRNVFRYRRLSRLPNRSFKWSLIQEPSDVYMLALFVFDLIQALGSITDLKWVIEGKVYLGPVCSAQGAMQQLGETGVALVIITIAVQTLVVWATGRGMHSVKPALFVVGLITLYVGLYVVIGIGTHANKGTLYESPTPYWCWIGEKYKKQRLSGEYVWLWIALIVSFLVYLPLSIWGIRRWWEARTSGQALDVAARMRITSLSVLSYPFSYSILVLPLSIVRWIGFEQEANGGVNHVPAGATIAVATIFGMSGVVNVLLFLFMKPHLLLFGPPNIVNDDVIQLNVIGAGAEAGENGAAMAGEGAGQDRAGASGMNGDQNHNPTSCYANGHSVRPDSGISGTRSRGASRPGTGAGPGGGHEGLPPSPVSPWDPNPPRTEDVWDPNPPRGEGEGS